MTKFHREVLRLAKHARDDEVRRGHGDLVDLLLRFVLVPSQESTATEANHARDLEEKIDPSQRGGEGQEAELTAEWEKMKKKKEV